MRSLDGYVKYGYVLRYYWSEKKQKVVSKRISMTEHPTFSGWAHTGYNVCLFCGSSKLEHRGVVEFLTPFNDFFVYNKCLECACKAYPKPMADKSKAPESAWEYFPHLPAAEVSLLKLPSSYWGRTWRNKAKAIVEYRQRYNEQLEEERRNREKVYKKYGLAKSKSKKKKKARES